MAYDPEILRRATARLEQRRRQRQENQRRLQAEIYRALPRAAEIDRQLRRTMVDTALAALQKGTDPTPRIQALRQENLALQAEQRALLQQAGFPPDGLENRPACAKCSDSGWTGAKMCACLAELCRQEQIKSLSSLLDLGDQNFDAFSLDYYPNTDWPGEVVTPYQMAEYNLDVCFRYAAQFRRANNAPKNLLLSGAPGLGKTFLSACVAREAAEAGVSVVYDTAVNIFARFESQKFDRDDDARDDTRRYLGCDLLILDDLGSELLSPFVQTSLYTIINSRLVSDRCTLISTNLSQADIRRRYSPQIASRLEGEYQLLHFYGSDIRVLKHEAQTV